jgi:hypothetical protein
MMKKLQIGLAAFLSIAIVNVYATTGTWNNSRESKLALVFGMNEECQSLKSEASLASRDTSINSFSASRKQTDTAHVEKSTAAKKRAEECFDRFVTAGHPYAHVQQGFYLHDTNPRHDPKIAPRVLADFHYAAKPQYPLAYEALAIVLLENDLKQSE